MYLDLYAISNISESQTSITIFHGVILQPTQGKNIRPYTKIQIIIYFGYKMKYFQILLQRKKLRCPSKSVNSYVQNIYSSSLRKCIKKIMQHSLLEIIRFSRTPLLERELPEPSIKVKRDPQDNLLRLSTQISEQSEMMPQKAYSRMNSKLSKCYHTQTYSN